MNLIDVNDLLICDRTMFDTVERGEMRWVGHVAHMENTHNILVVKPEGMRPLGKPKCKCKDNIKMDLKEIGQLRIRSSGRVL
jgi:hypothetical protein